MNVRVHVPRCRLAGILTLALLLGVAHLAAAAPGDLDPSFDGDGRVTTDFGGGNDSGNAVAMDSTGRIVVAGTTGLDPDYDFALARYLQSGALDTTFGGDGKITTDLGGADTVSGVEVDSLNRIVVAGSSKGDFAVARYLADGTLDSTFDGDGIVTTNFAADFDYSTGLVLDAEGRIVVVGEVGAATGMYFAVARYNTDGTLDTSFSGDGKVMTGDFWGYGGLAHGVALDQSGRIVVAGLAENDPPPASVLALVRYTPDGLLDTTFSGDGKQRVIFGGERSVGYGVTHDASQRILVVGVVLRTGENPSDVALARLNPDGSLDTSFDTDGTTITDLRGYADGCWDVTTDSAGRILVAGRSYSSSASASSDFLLLRYSESGALDPAFGAGGKVTTDFAGQADRGNQLAIDGTGRIVVAGSATVGGGTRDFAVARYLGDPSPPILKTYLPLIMR